MIAEDDVVRRWADVAPGARAPLVVLEPLRRFLDARGLGEGGITLRPVGDGHSNVTYLVARGELRLVLRRPPRPPLPPSAHDVLREARVMRALAGTEVPVPRVLATCEDPSVLGAPFVVMEHVAGPVVTTDMPATMDDAAARHAAGEALVDALAALGRVDWRAVGLEGLGRPDGYLERQLSRFSGLWERNRTRPLALVDDVARWLRDRCPVGGPATIVHGDFRLGNVILAPGPPLRIAAVLDWELSTIGDPLADLGYLLALWMEPGDPTLGAFEQGGLTRRPGFATRAQLAVRYEEQTGTPAAGIAFYEVLALWKLAVLMEGNVRRAQAGATDDAYLAAFAPGVVLLAEHAARRAGL
ncbi:phosphotransferase family protein [Baekduia soli]|uniref:Phosphotransferase family protein n=1 Tax=Baekduia soli TaxID=496014 RepID=A0A5B8UD07_9ACTN|nr:phosphotransferase family protein [Baekduia soli]QEC50552.1 phosphotransferase family protein [Baekduia soli]